MLEPSRDGVRDKAGNNRRWTMIVIGLIFLAAAAAVAVDVALENTGTLQVQAFGQSITASPGGILLVGVACGLV
ncbi:MAG TPA: hypothetical protein VGI06_11830, partial [Acidimicrobiales bacterium]